LTTKESNPAYFSWEVVYDNKEVNIPLLKNIMGASTTQKVIPVNIWNTPLPKR
jgi:hypothetical protein